MGMIELCPFADWEGLFAPQEILGCPRGWFVGKGIRVVTRLVVQFLGSEGISALALQQASSCCLSWGQTLQLWLWLGPGRVTPEARGSGLGARAGLCAPLRLLRAYAWWMQLERGSALCCSPGMSRGLSPCPSRAEGAAMGPPGAASRRRLLGGGAQVDPPGKVLHGTCKSRVERGLNNYRRSPIFLNKAISSILQE